VSVVIRLVFSFLLVVRLLDTGTALEPVAVALVGDFLVSWFEFDEERLRFMLTGGEC
jgi:hypothetical protein